LCMCVEGVFDVYGGFAGCFAGAVFKPWWFLGSCLRDLPGERIAVVSFLSWRTLIDRDSGGAGAIPKRSPGRSGEPAPRRRRHPAWLVARDLAHVMASLDGFREVAEKQVSLARRYVDDVSGRYIVLEGVDSCGGRAVKVVPYTHRFHAEYIKRLERRLKKEVLPFLEEFKHFSHVTLTIDPKRFPCQACAREAVSKAVHSLVTRLRRRYPWTAVLKAVEWQANGIGIHVHLLVAGKEYIPKDFIEATWSSLSSSGWAVEIRPVRGEARHVVRYLLKYILKSAGSVNVSSAVNWALNVRSLSVSLSRELRSRLKAIRERVEAERRARALALMEWAERRGECVAAGGEWRYVGTFTIADIKPGLYTGEDAERIWRVLSVYV